MVKTLVQRIALDGGKDIEKELKAIGSDGEAAFAKLKASADKLASSGSGLNSFLKQVRSDFTTIGAGAAKVSQGFDEIGASVVRFTRNAAILTGVIGGVGAGLFAIVKTASDAADAQGKAAASAGLSIKEYGRLQFAFEQGNVAADQFDAGMKKFNVTLNDAANGGKKSLSIFKSLGVNIFDSSGQLRPAGDIIASLADKFQKLPDGVRKSASAVALFGRAGAALVPVLNDGSKELVRLGDQVEKTGTVFTEQQAAIGDAFGDSLNLLLKTVSGFKDQFGLLLAPAFTEAFTAITTFLGDNKAQFLDLANVIANNIIPVIKDFANILIGNDSAVVNKNLLGIRDTFVRIGQAVENVASVVGTIFTVLQNTIQPFVDLYNTVLGPIFGKIDSQTALITVAIFALTGGFKLFAGIAKGAALIIEGIEITFGTTTATMALFGARIALLMGLLKTLADDIATSLKGAAGFVVDAFKGAVDAIGGFFSDLGDSVKGVIDNISSWIDGIVKAAQAAAAAVAAIFGGGGGSGGSSEDDSLGQVKFARGGSVRGRGTGTSDSIMARLSNGEFVLRAAAVRKYGTGFLHAINNLRAPGFAAGGLVRAVEGLRGSGMGLPAFAAGGLVGDGGRVSLDLTIGGETFADLLAPAEVVGKLQQFVMARAVRTAGKPPSWSKK